MPEIRFRSLTPVPPMVVRFENHWRSKPALLGRAAVADGFMPMMLFWTMLSVARDCSIFTPTVRLPEMTLRSSSAGVPMRLFLGPSKSHTPAAREKLGLAPLLPLASRPMMLPTILLPLARVSSASMP